MSEWRKIWANGLPTRTDLQNQAVGWLPKGCRSLGRGTVVRFPRIWMSSGECWFKESEQLLSGEFGICDRALHPERAKSHRVIDQRCDGPGSVCNSCGIVHRCCGNVQEREHAP